ncbi:MAG TPA: hypothetical protein VF574_02295 [Allosphingosinicella sp.]|jgi:hypothetical protein
MIISGVALAGLLTAAQESDLVLKTGNRVSPTYHRTEYESACGTKEFRVRFRNGPSENGRVDYLLIDNQPVRDAAETLQIRAARRGIDSIEIMHCGDDPHRPIFRGAMRLSKAESQVAKMQSTLFFRLTWEGRKGWRINVD